MSKSPEYDKLYDKVGRKVRKYCQLRDLIKKPNGDIAAHCISCPIGSKYDKIIISQYDLKKWHAGHYFKEKGSSGKKSVAFDEDNIHLQCYHCNVNLHGNESAYEENLRIKIGDERFESLKRRKNEIKIYSFGELQELDKIYSEKIKIEQKRLGKKW